MNCHACDGMGLVAFLPADSPVKEADATRHDLHFAVCLCAAGQAYRVTTNHGRSVAPQWVLWCARNGVDTSRVAMVEDVYSAEELAVAAITKSAPQMASREAALLSTGRKRK